MVVVVVIAVAVAVRVVVDVVEAVPAPMEMLLSGFTCANSARAIIIHLQLSQS